MKTPQQKSEHQIKRRIIGKLMIMIWASLESHILWPYFDKPQNNEKQNIEYIKEYAEMIKLLSDLL